MEQKKTNTFLKLFKKVPLFMTSKEKSAKYFEKKKVEAKMMMEAMMEIQRKNSGTIAHNISKYEGDSQEEIYLYDFISEYQNGVFISSSPISGGVVSGVNDAVAISSTLETIPPKIILKPIDVFNELETIPSPISLENLEEKITVLKMKKGFIKNNVYAKKEVIDMITRLENRRKYNEFKDFFEQFDNTTTEKINTLINKYELVLKTSDLFISKFPKEAMDIMVSYKNNVQKLCNKSPIFYVIAEQSMFKVEDKKNDPILLVQSPFGIYWQILGAWDKELILLEEL